MLLAELFQYVNALPDSDRDALGDAGLITHSNLRPSGYRASLPNFLPFASTGGDGVHFSVPATPASFGPVVMTVPMAMSERSNIVLGASLLEFLALGCRFGYFSLEQLAYDFDGTAAQIQAARHQSPALQGLSNRFGLAPWKSVRPRLLQLEALLPPNPC